MCCKGIGQVLDIHNYIQNPHIKNLAYKIEVYVCFGVRMDSGISFGESTDTDGYGFGQTGRNGLGPKILPREGL